MKLLKSFGLLILVLILLFAGYTVFRKNHFISKEVAIETYKFDNSQFVDWNGLDIHILEKGTGNTQSILLVHGLGGALHEFNPLGDELAKDYHVISFDLPGFGLSDAPEDQPDIQEFYHEFMDFVLEDFAKDTCFLVGNSMGGMITWNTALDHPERINKMVLLGAAGYDMVRIAEENAEWINQPSIKYLLARGAAPFIAKSNVEMCFYDDENIPTELFERKYGMMNKKGNLDWLKQLAGYKEFRDTALIQTIQTPTLIVWGDKDEIIPLEHAYKFERDLPNSKFILYPNCGHAPMIEELDKCASDIRAFLENE